VCAMGGVVSGLPAAGRGARHLDRDAPRLEKLDRGKSDAWPEQIDEASDEEANQRALSCSFRRRTHSTGRLLRLVAKGGSQDVASAARLRNRNSRGCEGRMQARPLAM